MYNRERGKNSVQSPRRRVKTGFCQRDCGQTNEQQRHYNIQPIQNYFYGMPTLPFSSVQYLTIGAMDIGQNLSFASSKAEPFAQYFF
jgi:hypothetical protein